MSFMGLNVTGLVPFRGRPLPLDRVEDLPDLAIAFPIGPEIPSVGKGGIAFDQFLSEHEITREAFENMLPGSRRCRRSDLHRPAFPDRAHQIRNQTIFGPV